MSTELHLDRVTLYKNNLAFYERKAGFTEPIENGEYVFRMDIPLKSKELIVDTLSVNAPGFIWFFADLFQGIGPLVMILKFLKF